MAFGKFNSMGGSAPFKKEYNDDSFKWWFKKKKKFGRWFKKFASKFKKPGGKPSFKWKSFKKFDDDKYNKFKKFNKFGG
jgi:hypothetical protein